jgi:hypothetical protein
MPTFNPLQDVQGITINTQEQTQTLSNTGGGVYNVTVQSCCQNPMSQMMLLRNFFGTLATGLRATTESLITVLGSRRPTASNSILNVNLSLPPVRIASISYFIYVDLYGPPPEGIFEETLINRIQQLLDLGLSAEEVISQLSS